MVFGYATNETPELMPMPILLANKLALRLTEVRKSGEISYLGPDGKTQVTVEYVNDAPTRVDTIIVSSQHTADVALDTIERDVRAKVIDVVIPPSMMDKNTKVLVNPAGRFVVGGPKGDSGMSGRKIIVDTYGGWHDTEAVLFRERTRQRSIGQQLTQRGTLQKTSLQQDLLTSARSKSLMQSASRSRSRFTSIRLARPTYPKRLISEIIMRRFALTPGWIINTFRLRRPIYRQVAAYGHFGRADLDLPWERTDSAQALQSDVNALKLR